MATIFGKPTPPTTDGGVVFNRELGFDVKTDASSTNISGLWYYRIPSAPTTATAQVWSLPGPTLLNTTASGTLVDGWNLITLSAPVAMDVGVSYTVAVYVGPCVIGYDGSGLVTDVVSGDGHLRALAGTGRYGNNLLSPTYPNQSWSGSWGIDLEYSIGTDHAFSGAATLGGVTAGGALTIGRALTSASTLGAATARGRMSVTAGTRHESGSGWYGLLSTQRLNQHEVAAWRARPPASCPRCGLVLSTGAGGVLNCPGGDYRYPRDGLRPTA